MNVDRHLPNAPGVSVTDDGEIQLSEIYRILVRGKYWVGSIVLATVLAALAYGSLVSPQWQASALIQIGQIGGTGPVEPPLRAVERTKQGTFENAVLTQLGIPLFESDTEATLFRKSFKAKVPANTDLIEVDVRAHSPEDAKRRIEAVVATLRAAHDKIAEPSVTRLRSLAAQVAIDVQRVSKERERLLKTLEDRSKVSVGERFSENVLIASILQTKDSELREFEESRLQLDENLNPAKTYPTSLTDSVYISEKPVFPKKTLIVLLSGLIGLIVGVMSAFIVDAMRRQSSPAE